jgi:hypothetical protein
MLQIYLKSKKYDYEYIQCYPKLKLVLRKL